MSSTQARLAPALEIAAGELGFAAASWLFVGEVGRARGDEGVAALREELGREFPVLHYCASRWLEGERPEAPDPSPVLSELEGLRRLLVVGIEAPELDALVAALPSELEVGLLSYRLLPVDWGRVLPNFGGRVESVDLGTFQSWAGARSALLSFVYGESAGRIHVVPALLRVLGPDVRTQFREIIGWDVLGGVPAPYPRWLVEIDRSELSVFIPRRPHEPTRAPAP